MKQITEDYCSFEIAKLLKEKGFDESTTLMIYSDGKIKDIRHKESNKNLHYTGKICACFTHQMALKWLRLCYDIIIDVSPNLTLNDVCKGGFMAEVYQYGHVVPDGEFGCNIADEYTYEEVVEASLLYVLKNLI